jgi:DNA-binding FrmR family transcriptional regulator
MRAIAEMIDNDAPCTEILRQMLAVRGAMNAIQRELWRAYLLDENCGLQSDEEEKRVHAWRELEAVLIAESEP